MICFSGESSVCLKIMVLLAAFGTLSFDDKRQRVGMEAFRQGDVMNMDVVKTKRALARFTVEMNMVVFHVAFSVA